MDLEDVIDELQTVIQEKFNDEVEQINSDKGDSIVLDPVDPEQVFFGEQPFWNKYPSIEINPDTDILEDGTQNKQTPMGWISGDHNLIIWIIQEEAKGRSVVRIVGCGRIWASLCVRS